MFGAMRALAFVILPPGGEDAAPGERETLQLQRADRAIAFDIGGLQHEAHRIDDFAVERRSGERILRRPIRNRGDRGAIGFERVQPLRQYMIEPPARGL